MQKKTLLSNCLAHKKIQLFKPIRIALRTWLWMYEVQEFFAFLLLICRQLLQIMWSDVAIIYFYALSTQAMKCEEARKWKMEKEIRG